MSIFRNRVMATGGPVEVLPHLLERTRATPGVVSASVVDNLPLHRISIANFYIAGRPGGEDGLPMADFAQVSPEYFSGSDRSCVQAVHGRRSRAKKATATAW
jgi:hypothetical protein